MVRPVNVAIPGISVCTLNMRPTEPIKIRAACLPKPVPSRCLLDADDGFG